MSFSEHLAKDRRLAILKLLVEVQGSANESVLRTGLEDLGHVADLTRERVREDLQFLSDRALVKLTWFSDKIAVAHITERGVEVAQGRIRVDGVKPPGIGV